MRTIHNLRVMVILSLGIVAAAAAAGSDGGFPAAFRLTALEARAAGLGGAYVSLADGASAPLWNPSGLAGVSGNNVSSTYRQLPFDRRVMVLSYARPLVADSGVGFAWVNAGAGRIMGYDAYGNPTEYLTNNQNLFFFAFGRSVYKDWFRLGTAGRFYWLRLADEQATGAGLDLAVSSRPAKWATVAFKVSDVFSRLRWYDVRTDDAGPREDIESTYTVGGSFSPWKRVRGAFELEKGARQELRLHFGGEYWLDERLAVRAGYDAGAPALGCTITYPVSWAAFAFDYAYTREGYAESAGHTATFGMVF